MSNVIGMGVVGCGAIGINAALEHLGIEDVHDRVRVVAVCDPAPGRAEAAAKKYGVPAHYRTLEELLADRNVDAVTIGSPIGLHYEQGMAAIAAGKHVHFNKTMCTTRTEADDLIRAAAAKGVRLVASPGQMLRPALRRLRKLVAEGALGKLIWAAASCGVSHYHTQEKVRSKDGPLGEIDPSWYYKRPAGGPLYDVTVYALHSLTGLVGPALRVCGMSGLAVREREFNGRKILCEMDDNTFMLIDFGDAFFGFSGGTVLGGVTRGQHTPTIFGTGGSILGTVFTPNKPIGGNYTFGEPGEPQEMQREGDHQPHVLGAHAKMKESHVFEDMMQLVDWVREGTPSIATAEHARHVIEIIEACYRAAATGQTQELVSTFEPLAAEECEV